MNSSRIILCADIGTSALKAAFIDTEGNTLAFAREAYASDPATAADWERALARALGSLFSQADDGCKPDAICVSGNGPTLVPVTKDGEALAPLHWYQGPQGSTAVKAPGATRSFFLPHTLRLRQDRPADYENTRYLFSVQEWLSWRLGADPVTALPDRYGPYYWDDAQCEALGLDRRIFPPYASLGTVIGKLSTAAIHRLGDLAGGLPEDRLSTGLPIVAGGVDFVMALVGAGAVEPGLVCDRAGTSEGINLCAAFPGTPQFPGDIRVLPHVGPGLWNLSVVIPESGRLFEWYRVLTGQESRPYEDTLAELIPDRVPGTLADPKALFFPGKPPVILGRASGAGNAGLFGRTDLGRAVLAAMGFKVRTAAETLGGYGYPVTEMRLSGGQGKNRRWNQLKADLCGISLLLPEQPDCELAGDAVLAAMALGEAADLREGVGRIVHIRERYDPDLRTAAGYGEDFQAYRATQKKLEAALNDLP
jgi:sugar (pentulose or hexulose) kinase